MKTLNAYGRLEKLNEIKAIVDGGAKFNGVIYGEKKGRYINLHVYVGGAKRYFKEVSAEDAEICKKEAQEFLGAPVATAPQKMGWGDAYVKYGFDFAEEGDY